VDMPGGQFGGELKDGVMDKLTVSLEAVRLEV